MSATPRQKACLPCASSKRRCDHELPKCRRCRDRDIDCEYPQSKRRRQDICVGDFDGPTPVQCRLGQEQDTWAGPIDHADNTDPSDGIIDVTDALEFGNWDPATELDMSFMNGPDMNSSESVGQSTHPINPLPALLPSPPDQGLEADSSEETPSSSSGCIPYFLRDETWPLQHKCPDEEDCGATVEMEPFIGEVEKMFQSWVKDGSNGFIHRRLYHRKMPTCVQDAFTTLAAYVARSPATKEIILQAADDRAGALLKQPPLQRAALGVTAEMEAHLARLHALFVYVFIRLFDGSVRFRASAEAQLPTLRYWQREMWQTVRRYTWREEIRSFSRISIDRGQIVRSQRDFDLDANYEATSQIWHLWVLTESLRRTYLVVDCVLNTYQIMSQGWADCEGFVMCTVHRGLWDAESPMKWFVLSCNAKAPLLAPSLSPGALMSQYSAEDFDDFAKMCWSFVVGAEKMQYWAESSTRPT
ncbi:hypothetical protein GGR56DRAFT_614722 [Xylariaceae sp. FL0804]|nr:hypothetical protein GGR56DRAFT_614722 [Xylariaceae sp. FL0804]